MTKQRIQSLCCCVAAASFALAPSTLRADDTKESKGARADKHAAAQEPAHCIQEAARMNNGVIQFSQLAARKGENSQLKQFAQTLERDHRQAQTDLERIAKKHNVNLDSASQLEAKCQEEMTRLEQLNGREFDREFAKGALEGHAMAAACLEQAGSQVKDADLSQYNRSMLAKVKQHQQRAREVARTVGLDETTISSVEKKGQDAAVGAAAGAETGADTEKERKELK